MRFFYIVCSIVFITIGCTQEKLTADFIIENVNIVDVENGTVKSNNNLAIEDGLIKLIYKSKMPTSDSVTIIDGSGKYLIPGLWDMHVHYHSNYNYSTDLLIANGIIGVREMWGKMDTINYLREQSKLGNIMTPEIYSSGNILNGKKSWMPFKVISNEDEAVNEIKKQIEEGVDFIKIYNRFTKEEFINISNICSEYNVPFSGHIPNSVSYWEAIKANQHSIEHQLAFLENCLSSTSKSKYNQFKSVEGKEAESLMYVVENFDRKIFDSLATSLSQSNTWICPTNVYWNNFYNRDNSEYMNNQRLEYVPKMTQLFWETPNEILDKKKNEFEAGRAKTKFQISLMKDLANKGVKILAGTDFPNPYCYPGFSLHDELQLMVDGGMTTAQTLKTATLNPAIFIKKENEFGYLKEGYSASMVLLDANPLKNISNTTKINAVFLRGKYLDRSKLDKLLLKAKQFSKASFKSKLN